MEEVDEEVISDHGDEDYDDRMCDKCGSTRISFDRSYTCLVCANVSEFVIGRDFFFIFFTLPVYRSLKTKTWFRKLLFKIQQMARLLLLVNSFLAMKLIKAVVLAPLLLGKLDHRQCKKVCSS